MSGVVCRFCDAPLTETVVNLGMSPVANNNIPAHDDLKAETFYPLHVYICTSCWLMQIPNVHTEDELFTDDYAYFSSYSDSWLRHAKTYVEMMVDRFKFGNDSFIVELASNDGYLLQYFKEKNIPVLGVEPCLGVARAAENKGIPSIRKFFGADVAEELVKSAQTADLVIANNVFAHVPDINDFLSGVKLILKPGGIVTMEFQYAVELLSKGAFDTIYHEHFTYYSFIAVQRIFNHHGLRIFDVDKLPTHGGSLRIYACHAQNNTFAEEASVSSLLSEELSKGINTLAPYKEFGTKVKMIKRELLNFLQEVHARDKTVIGYGAPAKGNTLLNYCSVQRDDIVFTVDKNPNKQDHLLPGTHIPIFSPEIIRTAKPH